MGVPGWILLTHNEEGKPVALFKDSRDTVTSIPMIIDERICSDTIFRVVQIAKQQYVVYDIEYLNGIYVFEKWNYQTRSEKIQELLELFHHTDLSAMFTIENAPHGTTIRGYEYYDDNPGTMGVFLPINT
jgi:hypothetical protein